MQDQYISQDSENRRVGFLISIILHIVLILLLLMPCLYYFDPPLEIQGVFVSFGNVDGGTQEVETKTVPQKSVRENTSPNTPKPKIQETVVPVAVESKTTDASHEIQAREKPVDKNGEVNESRDVETKNQTSAVDNAQREKQVKDEAKSKFDALLAQSQSLGESQQPKGTEEGRPDATALEGMSEAFGKVGDGLSDRGLIYKPKITDSTQKTGKVVINICVNSYGEVISAKFTQKGSTTTDSYLINLAQKNAMKYRFSESAVEEQCGSISINFKLR